MAGRRKRRGPDEPTPGSAADLGPDADPAEVARSLVLRSLTAAPRTRKQLADLLASRGVPDDVAEATLDRFTELHLVDDGEYARMWVRSRHQGRGLSRRALRHELQLKGVDREDIEAALELVDDEDELTAATEQARRKAAATEGLPLPTRQRRVMAALARKGYSSEVAWSAMREVGLG